MKQPFMNEEEKRALMTRSGMNKRQMQNFVRKMAKIHETQWECVRPVTVNITPLPHDFLKHSTFGKGTAQKRRIKRQLKHAA